MKQTNIGNMFSDNEEETFSEIIRKIKTGFVRLRKCTLIVALLIFNLTSYASDAINYQAIIRNTNGSPVANTLISVQITLLNDLVNENVVYQETHQVITNDLGMINLKIGMGNATAGIFDQINWGASTFFVRTAVDLTGGTSFEVIGTSQLLSVPYALYAKKAKELDVANLTETEISDLASKLNLADKATVVDPKITNTDYTPIAETKDVVVYQAKSIFNIEAVLGKIVVKKTGWTQFQIGTNGVNGSFGPNITLNSSTFPNLLPNSLINHIILLPWDRNSSLPVPSRGWRCCVITTKGQIYHNFPNRAPSSGKPDGDPIDGDIYKWDESVIWDLPNRRLPSKNSNDFPYSLNPCLPDACYEIHPALKQDNGYGNGGFDIKTTQSVEGKSVSFPRFYMPKRDLDASPISFMGGFETSDKIQIIGIYNSNTTPNNAARICAFITTDGGRQWFNKYEFANNNTLSLGNILNSKKIICEYQQDSFSFMKRNFIFPSSSNKEPSDLFSYSNEIKIKSISKTDSLVVTSAIPHNLISGDIIVIKKNDLTSSPFDFLVNDNINTKNGGNGKLWKVLVVSPTQFILTEYIFNPDTNLPARHIHAINKLKDGFIISTGEEYPQSWFIYLQISGTDVWTIVNAWDNLNFIRLNSSEKGLQRSLGTFLIDDTFQTVIYASDTFFAPNSIYTIEDRSINISRSSNGIYKGRLADIDDFSKFTCIYETSQSAYFFKNINDMWVFTGQQGELAISIDKGISWRKFTIPFIDINKTNQKFYKGIDELGRIYLDQLIIYRK
jgi:hypothetical protein